MSGDSYGAVSDTILIHAARSGDSRAFGTLWNRHHPAALRYATRLVKRADAEDLVAEAFTSIFQALRNGVGPEEVFRPYLYTTLKNLSIRWSMRESTVGFDEVDVDQLADGSSAEDEIVSAIEGSYEVAAFRSLPERWQEVLWYGEIEGLKPREIAVILGMNANAVAALAYRAREGFRRAWIEARAKDGLLADSPQDEALLARLRVVLIPLLVGIPAVQFLEMIGSSTPAQAASLPAAAVPSASSASTNAAALWTAVTGVASVTAAGVVLVAGIGTGGFQSGSGSDDSSSDRIATASGMGRGQAPAIGGVSIPQAPTESGAVRIPTVASEPGEQSPGPVSTPPPASTPPPPSEPLPQAAPPIVYSPAVGQAIPTAAYTVSGAGTMGSRVSVLVDGALSGVETVDPSSQWSHVIGIPLADGLHELTVVQESDAESPSAAQTIPFVVDTVVPAVPTVSSAIDRYSTAPPSLEGSAEPGATIDIVWQATTLATVTVDGSGVWSSPPLDGLQPYARELEVTQTDRAGNRSPASVLPLAFAPRFEVPSPYLAQQYSIHTIQGTAWPGSAVRTYFNGHPVSFGGNVVQYVGGSFTAYNVLSSTLPGSYDIEIGYVDPTTGEPHALESLLLVVVP